MMRPRRAFMPILPMGMVPQRQLPQSSAAVPAPWMAPRQLGPAPLGQMLVPAFGATPQPQHTTTPSLWTGTYPTSAATPYGTVSTDEYQGVEYTIDKMRKMVKDSLDREGSVPLRRLVESITAKLEGKDYVSEIAAIYYWGLTNIRYMRDPRHIEWVQSPLLVLQPEKWDAAAGRRARQVDCEEMTATLAAMMMQAGNKAEFVTITTDTRIGFHHVFVAVSPNDGGPRIVCDPVPGPEVTDMLKATQKHQVWPCEPVRYPGRPNQWTVAGMQGGDFDVAPGPAYEAAGPPAMAGFLGEGGWQWR